MPPPAQPVHCIRHGEAGRCLEHLPCLRLRRCHRRRRCHLMQQRNLLVAATTSGHGGHSIPPVTHCHRHRYNHRAGNGTWPDPVGSLNGLPSFRRMRTELGKFQRHVLWVGFSVMLQRCADESVCCTAPVFICAAYIVPAE